MSLVHGQFLHVGRGAKLQICQKLVPPGSFSHKESVRRSASVLVRGKQKCCRFLYLIQLQQVRFECSHHSTFIHRMTKYPL